MTDTNNFKEYLIKESVKAINTNLKTFLNELEDEYKVIAKDAIESITQLTIKMALTTSDKEKEECKATIAHYKNALENIDAATQYKTYSKIIKTIGEVIAAIGVGVTSALL